MKRSVVKKGGGGVFCQKLMRYNKSRSRRMLVNVKLEPISRTNTLRSPRRSQGMFSKVRCVYILYIILFGATILLKIKLIDTPVRELYARLLSTINNTAVTLTSLFFHCCFHHPVTPFIWATPPRFPARAMWLGGSDGIRNVDILITTHKKQLVICTWGKVKCVYTYEEQKRIRLFLNGAYTTIVLSLLAIATVVIIPWCSGFYIYI